MSLASRLVLTVALTAVFSVTLTGLLSYRAAGERVPRAFGVMAGPRGQGAGAAAAAEERTTMVAASRALLAELQRATVQAAGIALLLAVVVGSAVALRTTQPLARVADVTRRYGAGERDLRAPTSGPDEIADLGRVFNDTADRLQAEEDQRRRFTTDVAHELRTPLTVLKSELEAIQDGLMASDPATVAQLLQQVDLLTRLVQDLRILTLAEAGALTLQRERIDLAAVVGGAARAFGSRAGEAGVRIEVEARPVSADADGDRLHQIVNALLDNALRHAPEASAIRVTVGPRGPDAVIEVLDEGPGIPANHLQHVFRRLYRTDDARLREAGGSGLGLAIVAAIVALHGGTVEAANRPTGGAVFTVKLPLPDA